MPRDKNYITAEDELLCSAWLNVSKDATVGTSVTSQPAGPYWARVTKYFNDFRRTDIERSINSCQKRWGDIQKETYRFSCCYGEVQRMNQSGKSEDDKIKDALELYRGRFKSFKYLHCWLILRHEQKWNDYVAGLATPKQSDPPVQRSPSVEVEPSPSIEVEPSQPGADRRPYERPTGRGRAKKQRTSSTPSNSSACFEMLQKMQLDRARFEEYMKAANKEECEAMSSRADRKLALQEQQLELQREMFKLNQKEREDRIMSTDLDKVSPWARQYYVDQQKTIAARAAQEAAFATQAAEQARGDDNLP